MCHKAAMLFQRLRKILRKIQDICKIRSEPRIVHYYSRPDHVVPLRENVPHGFINPGENTSKIGPGDKTGASYAFDLYDFANGTYHWEI